MRSWNKNRHENCTCHFDVDGGPFSGGAAWLVCDFCNYRRWKALAICSLVLNGIVLGGLFLIVLSR